MTVTEQYESSNPDSIHLPGFSTPIRLPFPANMPLRLETATELSQRDPEELIPIPMLLTVKRFSLKQYNPFSPKTSSKEMVVTIRPMRRGQYRERYAKDAKGEFIGTGKPALDQGLVFVPDRVYKEGDVERDVKRVAFGKEHYGSDFAIHGEGAGA
jgi:hypothetical protein